MDLSALIQRLQERVGALRQVAGAAGFQVAVESGVSTPPAAYAVLLEERAAASEFGDAVIQRVEVLIAVCLVVRNVADARGAAAAQDMDALRGAVKTALLGWVPAEGCDPLQRTGARLLTFTDGLMWWQETYRSAYYDRSPYD